MIKRLTISLLLIFSYLTASAQIATPLLDRNLKVRSSAATGWRDGSTVGINAINLEGKFKDNGTEIADVTIGGSIPGLLAAFKGEELALELYVSTDTTQEADFAPAPLKQEAKIPETRLNLAYVFGEALSIGLGHRVNETKFKQTTAGIVTGEDKKTKTGLMVSASLKLADIFYVAGGMENVDFKRSSGSTDSSNAWTNTIVGLGLRVGDSGESRFRVEYDIIQSPKKEKDLNTATEHVHYKTDRAIMSLEAQFGDFILSYINDTVKESDIPDSATITHEDKTVITDVGIGWMPEEGFSVSVYATDYKNTLSFSNGGEIIINPKGYRLNLGWNF